MKKLLFAMLFLFASSLFAQSEVILKYITKDSQGRERVLIVSDSTGSGYGYLPVKIMSGSTSGSGTSGGYIVLWDSLTTVKLQTIIDSAHVKDSTIIARLNSLVSQGTSLATEQGGATTFKASVTTLTTEIDSVDFSSQSWFDGDVQLAYGDTIKIKVSMDRTFPAAETWYVYPSTLFPIGKVDVGSKPKIYFKRVAGSGTANYQYRLRGR